MGNPRGFGFFNIRSLGHRAFGLVEGLEMFNKSIIGNAQPKNEGLSHWRWQRITAVALIPLTLWFVVSVTTLPDSGYSETIQWISNPIIAILITFFAITSLYHASLGVQVVIEDYIHNKSVNKLTLIGSKLIFAGLGCVALVAIAKILFFEKVS